MEKRSSPPQCHQNSTADSGFCSSSAIQTSSLEFSATFQSTPCESLNISSRKRKICQLNGTPISRLGCNVASSTLNESAIAQSFEKCNISSFTPNYYMQRAEYCEPESPKKRQHSEPSTPAKVQTIDEEEEEETEFFRQHNSSFHKTPTKLYYQRLGSPECSRILYGGELRANSAKLRYDAKRHSPAKKRLFRFNEFETRQRPAAVNPHRKFDPVRYFVVERNIECVFERVLPCLSDEDLYSFVRVCKEWRKLVLANGETSARLEMFMEKARRNKENSFENSFEPRRKSSGSLSSALENKQDENQSPGLMSVNNLREGQRYRICPKCSKNAIVECNIVQCTQLKCGYIYCLNCNSCSTSGPENFRDSCMQSKLLIPTVPTKLRLTLSPRRDSLSFLMNSPPPKAYAPRLSETDDGHQHARHSDRRHSSVLGDCNRDVSYEEEAVFAPRTVPVLKVVSVERRRIEVMEPSSPPKIKHVAGSIKSKKYLKRLLRN